MRFPVFNRPNLTILSATGTERPGISQNNKSLLSERKKKNNNDKKKSKLIRI